MSLRVSLSTSIKHDACAAKAFGQPGRITPELESKITLSTSLKKISKLSSWSKSTVFIDNIVSLKCFGQLGRSLPQLSFMKILFSDAIIISLKPSLLISATVKICMPAEGEKGQPFRRVPFCSQT